MMNKIKCLILRHNMFAVGKSCCLVKCSKMLFYSLYYSKSLSNINHLVLDHFNVQQQQLTRLSILSLLFVLIPIHKNIAKQELDTIDPNYVATCTNKVTTNDCDGVSSTKNYALSSLCIKQCIGNMNDDQTKFINDKLKQNLLAFKNRSALTHFISFNNQFKSIFYVVSLFILDNFANQLKSLHIDDAYKSKNGTNWTFINEIIKHKTNFQSLKQAFAPTNVQMLCTTRQYTRYQSNIDYIWHYICDNNFPSLKYLTVNTDMDNNNITFLQSNRFESNFVSLLHNGLAFFNLTMNDIDYLDLLNTTSIDCAGIPHDESRKRFLIVSILNKFVKIGNYCSAATDFTKENSNDGGDKKSGSCTHSLDKNETQKMKCKKSSAMSKNFMLKLEFHITDRYNASSYDMNRFNVNITNKFGEFRNHLFNTFQLFGGLFKTFSLGFKIIIQQEKDERQDNYSHIDLVGLETKLNENLLPKEGLYSNCSYGWKVNNSDKCLIGAMIVKSIDCTWPNSYSPFTHEASCENCQSRTWLDA